LFTIPLVPHKDLFFFSLLFYVVRACSLSPPRRVLFTSRPRIIFSDKTLLRIRYYCAIHLHSLFEGHWIDHVWSYKYLHGIKKTPVKYTNAYTHASFAGVIFCTEPLEFQNIIRFCTNLSNARFHWTAHVSPATSLQCFSLLRKSNEFGFWKTFFATTI